MESRYWSLYHVTGWACDDFVPSGCAALIVCLVTRLSGKILLERSSRARDGGLEMEAWRWFSTMKFPAASFSTRR